MPSAKQSCLICSQILALADRLDDLVERQQQLLIAERRAGDRLAVRQFGRTAGGERRHDLAFEVVPGSASASIFTPGRACLEALDDFSDRRLRRRVGFGVPDPNRLDGLSQCRPGEPNRNCAAEQDSPSYLNRRVFAFMLSSPTWQPLGGHFITMWTLSAFFDNLVRVYPDLSMMKRRKRQMAAEMACATKERRAGALS